MIRLHSLFHSFNCSAYFFLLSNKYIRVYNDTLYSTKKTLTLIYVYISNMIRHTIIQDHALSGAVFHLQKILIVSLLVTLMMQFRLLRGKPLLVSEHRTTTKSFQFDC
jgi:hypothetical protein